MQNTRTFPRGRYVLHRAYRMYYSLIALCCLLVFPPYAEAALPISHQQTVTGRISTADNTPLAGVSVVEKGTQNTTVTNDDGQFTLTVANVPATLVFTYIGYASQEIQATSGTPLSVTLQADLASLDEVVVVGYGTVDKRDLTTAVTTMRPKDLIQGSVSPLMAIQGKVPGLTVASSNGTDPNANISVQLRGINSVNASQGPLIVIDGVPGGSMSTVVREDIESINVLRDASAAAIYGTRASGGVILITTKRARAGSANITYTTEGFVESVRRRPEVLSPEEYLAHDRGDDLGHRTDWYNEVTNDNAFSHRHVINASGGTENAQVYATFNYRDATGIAIGSKRKEYGGRINSSFKLLNGLAELTNNISYNHRNSDLTDNGIFNMALVLNPTETPYDASDPTGYNVWTGGYDYWNPVAEVMLRKNQNEYRNLLANSTLKVNLTEDFNTSVMVGINNSSEHPTFYRSSQHRISRLDNVDGYASQEYKRWNDRTFEWTANYSKQLVDHNINAVVGYSYQDFNGQGFNANNSDFPVDGLEEHSMGNGTFLPDGRAGMGSWKNPSVKLAAFFGRLNYSFMDRYLLTATIRREGSSKFAPENRWGTFPGVSLGWRVSEEAFLKNSPILNDLKIRGGYGETGNEGFGSEVAFRMYSPDTWWLANDQWIRTFGVRHNQNADIKWEVKKEFNVGFDFGLFNSRLSGWFDYYVRKVDDMIYSINVSQPPAIHDQTTMNVGNMENRGFEGEVTGVIVDNENWEYSTTLAFSHNKSVLKSLWGNTTFQDRKGFPAPGSPGNAVRLYPGEEIGQFFLWRHAGFTEEGNWMLYDAEGNAFDVTQQTKTLADKAFVGNAIPRAILSWNHSVRYKQFDAGVYMRSWLGYDVFNMINMYYSVPNVAGQNVLKKAYEDHANVIGEKELSDYWLEKGNFVKVDAISVGYTLPQRWLNPLKSVRVYATGRDLLVFTKYSGLDPEVNINGLDPGFEERDAYPKTRTFMFGVQVNF
ncbi:SusC/RagA family TonB-linked outer membrane protein [Parapedobacter sp. DT-150]|uniref:SusC/RagA family TonB-linked outer membrane protein n=1 Tax=Parapedobacter sp. DT-150 TaxID=3396162 RepID=UPI003F1CF3B2